MDKPVIVRTLPRDESWKPSTGIVFDVHDDSVDLMTSPCTMKTIQLAMIIDVALDHNEAKDTVIEEPPRHSDYQKAKRALFEAEEAQLFKQPAASVQEKARSAEALLRAVRKDFPGHLWTEQMLERAHFLATGRYDYECDENTSSGDVDNFNYQWAKARVDQLDAALKARRPEDEIAGHISRIAKFAGRALAKFPRHADLKAWFEKAEKIRSRLSEDVRKSSKITEPFVPGRD
jgi:hypothetical protein